MANYLLARTVLVALGASIALCAHAEAPEQLATTLCAACHGPDGNSVDPSIPKIAGKDAGYLRKQLKHFISGQRSNAQMSPIAQTLSEDAVVDLAKFFSTRIPNLGKVSDAALAASGKQIYEDGNSDTGVPACSGCHQSDGSGNARFPRVGGQHVAYSLQQLMDFKAGRRATDRLMATVGQRLSAQEMKAVAEYMASLDGGIKP
ncbi:MAG: cytochrome c4 [Rhodoferax sp.]|nr:cytochrome c4 [Rhodoferax sp.]